MPEPTASESFEQAKALFIDGLACFEAGRFDTAEQRFAASLALVPGRVSTLVNLAATQLKLARPEAALRTAGQTLAVEPGNLEARLHRSAALAQLGRLEEALASYRGLLALAPELAIAWSDCGTVLRELNRPAEAAEAFRQAIAHGGDAELTGYYLASVSAQRTPATAPRAYVEPLFDSYAGGFEEHLLQVLHYRAHTVLARELKALAGGRFASALDLGCGTGLCGPLVRPMVDRLVGVDLSARMIERARALGVYTQLVHADILDHLRDSAETHDLVLAADVFIYIGDLAPVFAALHGRMRAGGLLCFSAEPASDEGPGFELLPSLRYAHSQRWLRELAAQHGFDVVKATREPLREDQGVPVEGLFVYLAKR